MRSFYGVTQALLLGALTTGCLEELPDPDAGLGFDSGVIAAGDGGDAAPGADASAPPSACPDGFPRGAPGAEARQIAAFSPSPEGVTVCPGGDLFVALDGSGEIWRMARAGGAAERWAQLGDVRPAGISCDERGRLFVAMFATRSGGAGPIHMVMVPGKDAAPVAMPQPSQGDPLTGLNGIVAVPALGVFASDTSSGRIVFVRERSPGEFETRVVASDLSLANGLAYRAATRELFAVASGAFGVFAFRVGDGGVLSERRAHPVGGFVLFMDGVAVDASGEVYVADYLLGAVVRASDGRAVATLPNPASLAFRGGTLFITSYDVFDQEADGALYALDLGVCGY